MDWEVRAVSLFLCLAVLLASIHDGNAERKIVCYYTNWSVYRPGTAKFSPQNINPYLCTHLIYAFGGFTKDNTLKPFDKYQDIEKGGYAKFTGLKTYNKNLKTMLAIGGWNEGSSRFSPMVADPGRRREFVKNSVKFLRQNHFDGLDLDWEYPAFRDGGKPRDRDNYANLVQELREEFERESSKTGRPRLLLSMAMPAGIQYIDKGYDLPRLNEYLDFINLLSYDYHSAFEPAVNHHSPLYPLEEDNEYNYDSELTIDYTINYLMKQGASSEKIVLGIPTYGRSYTLFNEDSTDLGSPADGPGEEGEATREKGYLAYYEICESIAASDDWEVVQPNPDAMGPYAFKGNQWVGYDDEDIVKLKAKYVNEKNLGGIMFWSIDNDDFRGKCHGRPYPLIEAAKEALLTGSSSSQKPKSDIRKKTRPQSVQSNTIGRKLGQNGRRSTTTTTTVAPTRKRTNSRTKYRPIHRSKISEEEDDREAERRSYAHSSEEDNLEVGNAVGLVEKAESRTRTRTRPRSRSSSRTNRRKSSKKKGESKSSNSDEENLSNKLTTPEPPTTPDPGTDFKCEDEGFFSHPRDCKKYFWCLDSGPGGLGVVAHQFTCPSGLVFNKAADSCDYPRNVVCPKSKTSQSTVSTTRAPITAATSRTTYLHSTTRRTTTTTSEPEEDEEYYDDEEESVEEEDDDEEEEIKPEPKVATTSKPLQYKTITRNRPTTTTTTTTTTAKPLEKISESDVEEDPRVIKELIDLIKKAGGIEQLEKQLLFQEKGSDASPSGDSVTPATISRTLYERVLSRQANRFGNIQRSSSTSSKTVPQNGPGRSQFEGLDDIPEVKSLRRSQKPQYVTIERPKSSTKEPPLDDEVEDEGDEDNADIASSEEQTISSPLETSSIPQRVTPNYVNIRRNRPTPSKNENDVGTKDEEVETERRPLRRRRPAFFKNTENSDSLKPEESEEKAKRSRLSESVDETPTTKSRYITLQRSRSTTTSKPTEHRAIDDESNAVVTVEATTESIMTTTATKQDKEEETTIASEIIPSSLFSSTPSTSTTLVEAISSSTTSESTPTTSSIPETSPSSTTPTTSSTTEAVRLVEESATEILFTTAPASASSQTTSPVTTRLAVATVSQPRPFGFTRRSRPSTSSSEATTTPIAPTNDLSRSKVANSDSPRLPTLKELVGYNSIVTPSTVHLSLFPIDIAEEIDLQSVEQLREEETSSSLGRNEENLRNNNAPKLSSQKYSFSVDLGSDVDTTKSEKKTFGKIDEKPLEDELWSEKKTDDTVQKKKGNETGSVNDRLTDNNYVDYDPSRIRIDRASGEMVTENVKPTTMRGTFAPPSSSTIMRGFYVTRSDVDFISTTAQTVPDVTNVSDPKEPVESTNELISTTSDLTTTAVAEETSTILYDNDHETQQDSHSNGGLKRIKVDDMKEMSILKEETKNIKEEEKVAVSNEETKKTKKDDVLEETQSTLSDFTDVPTTFESTVPRFSTVKPLDVSIEISKPTSIENYVRRRTTQFTTPISVTGRIDFTSTQKARIRSRGRKRYRSTTSGPDQIQTTVSTWTEPSFSVASVEPEIKPSTSTESNLSSAASIKLEIKPTTLKMTDIPLIKETTKYQITETTVPQIDSTVLTEKSVSPALLETTAISTETTKLTTVLDLETSPILSTEKISNGIIDVKEYTMTSTELPTTTEEITIMSNLFDERTTASQIPVTQNSVETTNLMATIKDDIATEYETATPVFSTVSTTQTEDKESGTKDLITSTKYSGSTNYETTPISTTIKFDRTTLREFLSSSRKPDEHTTDTTKQFIKETTEYPVTTTQEKSTAAQIAVDNSRPRKVGIIRRNRIRYTVPDYEFGRATSRRKSSHRRVNTGQYQEDIIYPRRRVHVHRGRQRRPHTTSTIPEISSSTEAPDTVTNHTVGNIESIEDKTIENTPKESPEKKSETEDEEKARKEEIKMTEEMDVTERHEELDQSPGQESEHSPSILEKTDRPINEVKYTSTTRKPISLLSNRIRKPITSPSSKLPSTVAGFRKTTLPSRSVDVVEGATEATKRAETESDQKTEIDQSSRAQELAVTLADPPLRSTSNTGRPSLRDSLRRRISTTIAPRTESTTKKFTSTIARSRQDSKTQDRISENVTSRPSRPRRPPVKDYDYYEDEDEPAIVKSTFKGKLYLTSKGTIKCLDQGNFPHPFSCKKFISCARMVNGQVVGAEYTCPDKLSFDPVGGICNWSAGLGCKE